ncbi:alpha/beta hydrolase [Mycobacterium sp. NBC_00419]|uniref:alpha/beta fold hydrolase n=1 Tax=Mycobacterium sp. NBC_00419 TaxID=2975989 RepID=UPI002E23ED27
MAQNTKTDPAQPVSFRGNVGTIRGDRWTPAGDVRGSLLLLHGGGQTRHSWRKSAPGLQALGWDVVALDARGHGESDWASDGDYRIDRLVDDLTAVIAQLADDSVSPGPPVVIGASMGGITGLVAEGENPGLLRALVLVDIAPRIEPAGVQRISDFMCSAPDGFADLSEVAEAVSAYRGDAARPANVDSLRRNVRTAANGRLFWHWDPAFTTSDRNLGDHAAMLVRTTAAASNVAIPTLLVWGSKSDIVDVAAVEELRTLIPHATTVTISDATHMVVGDDNDTFVAGTAAFLAGL